MRNTITNPSFFSKRKLFTALAVIQLGVVSIFAQCPSASFTTTAPSCANTPVDFTNTSGNIGAGWSYFWRFDYPAGGGASPATSTLQNPTAISYSFGGPGVYTVLLTITNGTCTSTSLMDIDIRTARANFTPSKNNICVGDSVLLFNTGTLGSSPNANVVHSWSFGAGANPSTSNAAIPPAVKYLTSGSKTVTHFISVNYSPCAGGTQQDLMTQVINVNPSPTPNFSSNSPVCQNAAVNFTYTGGGGTTYNWDFGQNATPQNSTAKNPSGITYTSAGTKTITLTASNSFGCSTTIANTITINSTPVSNFSSTAPVCTGLPVDFTNTGTTAGVTYAWGFGSGASVATSSVQSPTGIVYSTAGTKIISLITTDALTGCTSSTTQPININLTPTSTFTTNAPQCAGAPVNFTNTGSTGTSWSYGWDLGQDASPKTSSSENLNGIMYSSGGNKTITFTIFNGNCAQTTTQTITINSTPVSNFSSTAPVCTGLPVDFINTGTTAGVTYAWGFGSGASVATSSVQSPTGIVYSTAGTKIISLITTNTLTGCTSTTTQPININLTPTSTFTTNAPQCAGSSVNFTNTGSTGINWSYSWDLGQNASPKTSSSENLNNIIYSSGGNKTITFTIFNGNCTQTTTQTITINSLPLVNAGKDTIICANTSIQIGSASLVGYSYSWIPSSTLTINNSTISNPIASPIAPITKYSVTMTNTATGCSAKSSVNITMLPPIIANAGADGVICRKDSIQLGAALVNGQTYSWLPTAGLSNSTSPNPSTSPSVTTTYTLTAARANCKLIKDQVTIIVHQLPKINAGKDDTITVGSSVQLVATGGIQYNWSPFYGLNNSGVFNPIASPTITSTYIVKGTDVYGCINYDTINVIVNTPDFWLPNAFTPNDDSFNDMLIVRGNGINNFEFGVFTKWGEEIFFTKDMKIGWDGKKQITGELLPEGAYVYVVKGTKTNGDPVNVKGLVNLIR